MPQTALANGVEIEANNVDRDDKYRTHSSIKYLCISCGDPLSHVNASRLRDSHFRHRTVNPICELSYNESLATNKWYTSQYRSDFVKRWVSNVPYGIATYNLGSDKGLIKVHDEIHPDITTHLLSVAEQKDAARRLFILNGLRRGTNIYKTEADIHEESTTWLSVEKKNELIDIVEAGYIVGIDVGCDRLFIITNEMLQFRIGPKYAEYTKFSDLFKCDDVSIGDIVHMYFPSDYVFKMLHNPLTITLIQLMSKIAYEKYNQLAASSSFIQTWLNIVPSFGCGKYDIATDMYWPIGSNKGLIYVHDMGTTIPSKSSDIPSFIITSGACAKFIQFEDDDVIYIALPYNTSSAINVVDMGLDEIYLLQSTPINIDLSKYDNIYSNYIYTYVRMSVNEFIAKFFPDESTYFTNRSKNEYHHDITTIEKTYTRIQNRRRRNNTSHLYLPQVIIPPVEESISDRDLRLLAMMDK